MKNIRCHRSNLWHQISGILVMLAVCLGLMTVVKIFFTSTNFLGIDPPIPILVLVGVTLAYHIHVKCAEEVAGSKETTTHQ